MFTTRNNYETILKKLDSRNRNLSEEYLQMLEKLGVSNFHLVSVGNSISSGYSKCDSIIPFVMRSHIFELSKESPQGTFYSFARVRHNEDENVLRWYHENTSQKVINQLLIQDILEKKEKYVQKCWTSETISRYEQFTHSEIGFRDVITKSNPIVIYHGLTGTLTDVLRKGNAHDRWKLVHCFSKDLESVRGLFQQIYWDNPETQLYVCGLPNIMGSGIISLFDHQLKKVCHQFPNTVFVPGTIRSSFFYLDGQQEFDVHYNVPEYLQVWNQVTEALIENYLPLSLKGKIVKELQQYQKATDCGMSDKTETHLFTSLDHTLDQYFPLFYETDQSITEPLNDLAKFYDQNYLVSFSNTPREKVMKKLLAGNFRKR